MGACEFGRIQMVKGGVREAYREANTEANEENGHQDGYSGDIQTTHGYKPANDHPRFGTKAFDKWESELTHDMDKGDCVVVEIKGATFNRMKERRGLKGRKGIRAFYFFGLGSC